MNKLTDTARRRLHHIRTLDPQLFTVLKKCFGIKPGDIHNGFMFSLGACQHLILSGIPVTGQMPHVCNIHNPLHIISCKTKIFFQNIFHNITSQVADMGKMIHRRSTGIHSHLSRFIRHKFFHFFGKGIV